jgi:hypothetical protein
MLQKFGLICALLLFALNRVGCTNLIVTSNTGVKELTLVLNSGSKAKYDNDFDTVLIVRFHRNCYQRSSRTV